MIHWLGSKISTSLLLFLSALAGGLVSISKNNIINNCILTRLEKDLPLLLDGEVLTGEYFNGEHVSSLMIFNLLLFFGIPTG